MREITKWLYLSDISHLAVREWINGLWFAVSACAMTMFGAQLLNLIASSWLQKGKLFTWYGDLGTRAIIALFFYFLGETLMRGWIWLLLVYQNEKWDATTLQSDYYIAFIAATLSTWGALCCIWIFSRSHWAWIVSALFILGFVLLEIALVSHWSM